MIATAVATVIGMAAFLYYFFLPWLWAEAPWFLVTFAAIVLVVFSIFLYYAVVNIRANKTFICELDDDEIRCVCPVKACGESFTLRLGDVTTVERHEEGDSHRWYLHDTTGRRYWLTSNYGNPVDEFVALLRTLNHDILRIDS